MCKLVNSFLSQTIKESINVLLAKVRNLEDER